MAAKKIRIGQKVETCLKPIAFEKISIDGFFGFYLNEYLISFWNKSTSNMTHKVPDNIHFTIAFNSDSKYVNLHLTKNVQNDEDKPAVRIVVIDKQLLEELAPYISNSIFNAMFELINVFSFTKNKAAYFVANAKFQRSKNALLFGNRLIKHFKPLSRKDGKNRYKIKGDVNKPGEEFYMQNGHELINLLRIRTTISTNADTCYIPGDPSIILKKINGKWYKLRDINLDELIVKILGGNLMTMINCSFKRGLVVIRSAISSKDTEEFNRRRTVRLIKKDSMQ